MERREMKLAVSNIAWPAGMDAQALPILSRHGATGIEIAPTKVWSRPIEVSEAEAREYRRQCEQAGFAIVAFQALLFGQPQLSLFDSGRAFLDYVERIIRLAGWLGAKVLVFGSPKNRRLGTLDPLKGLLQAVDTFRLLGDRARSSQTILCIEPNPTSYECDFITTLDEALQLVRAVDHPGFGLHLDAGALTLNGERLHLPPTVSPAHFHISEPFLAPIGQASSPHAEYARALRQMCYTSWHSIELREPTSGWEEQLERSLIEVDRLYRQR
jgi:sugar phosphate isomerase/epimerase